MVTWNRYCERKLPQRADTAKRLPCIEVAQSGDDVDPVSEMGKKVEEALAFVVYRDERNLESPELVGMSVDALHQWLVWVHKRRAQADFVVYDRLMVLICLDMLRAQ